MSRKTLDSSTFGSKIYKGFPKVYRDEDATVNYALKRYLQALNDGGFKPLIDKSNELLDIFNPDKVEVALIPHLFASFGFDLFYGLPEDYVRKLLPLLGTLYRRKGAVEDVEFLTSLLSGLHSEVNVDEDPGYSYNVDIVIDVDVPEEIAESKFPDHDQMRRIAVEFLPFYCDTTIRYHLLYSERVKLMALDEKYESIDWVDNEVAEFEVSNPGCLFGVAVFGDNVFGSIETVETIYDNVKCNDAENVNMSINDFFRDSFSYTDTPTLAPVETNIDDVKEMCLMGVSKLGARKLGKYSV